MGLVHAMVFVGQMVSGLLPLPHLGSQVHLGDIHLDLMKSDVRGPSSHIATRKARPNGALALAIESLGFEAPRRPKPSIDIVGSPVETILTDAEVGLSRESF